MQTRSVLVLLAGSLGALTLLAASASARTARPTLHERTLTVHVSPPAVTGSVDGPIGGIALDGTQAAYVRGVRVTPANQLGQRLYRWNLATGRASLVSGAKTHRIPQTSTGRGISEIALAGSHSAWVVSSGGNTESSETLLSSTAKPRKDKVLVASDRFWDGQSCSSLAGTWLGGLVSDGSRIWYARWSTQAGQGVTQSALWRISGSSATKIASDSGAVVSASADGGRIALLRTDGTVAVYSSSGTLLNTITGAGPVVCGSGDPGEGVALTGKLVAALTEKGHARQAGSIKVYDRTTGELLHTWTASGFDWQFDAYGGIAVYVKGTRLHAIDLRTGKDVVVAKRTRAIQGVRLDHAGLLYYLNLRWSAKEGQDGKLVFVPFRTVAAKLGR
jgi:hypothetical protein